MKAEEIIDILYKSLLMSSYFTFNFPLIKATTSLHHLGLFQ